MVDNLPESTSITTRKTVSILPERLSSFLDITKENQIGNSDNELQTLRESLDPLLTARRSLDNWEELSTSPLSFTEFIETYGLSVTFIVDLYSLGCMFFKEHRFGDAEVLFEVFRVFASKYSKDSELLMQSLNKSIICSLINGELKKLEELIERVVADISIISGRGVLKAAADLANIMAVGLLVVRRYRDPCHTLLREKLIHILSGDIILNSCILVQKFFLIDGLVICVLLEGGETSKLLPQINEFLLRHSQLQSQALLKGSKLLNLVVHLKSFLSESLYNECSIPRNDKVNLLIEEVLSDIALDKYCKLFLSTVYEGDVESEQNERINGLVIDTLKNSFMDLYRLYASHIRVEN